MGTNIFLLVNGFGVSFLLYVLMNFWKEARQLRKSAQKQMADHAMHALRLNHASIATSPISDIAYRESSTMQIYSEEHNPNKEWEYKKFVEEIEAVEENELPSKIGIKTKRLSTRLVL